MTELLAFLTAIFVVYVLYEVFKTVSQAGSGPAEAPPAARPPAPVAQVASKPAPQPAAAAKAAEPQPAVVAKAPEPAPAEHKVHNLRNPATGEISPAPGNYRFAKKWIKEAMVKEGLLNKVYKNSELTETVNAKAKDALEQFKKLEQYQA